MLILNEKFVTSTSNKSIDISYDNNDSKLQSDNVQNAIDEINEELNNKSKVIANVETTTESKLITIEIDGEEYKISSEEGGTEVIANPELIGDEDILSSIEIDGVKYKIQGIDGDGKVLLTKAQYDALPESKLTDGRMYCLTDIDVEGQPLPFKFGIVDEQYGYYDLEGEFHAFGSGGSVKNTHTAIYSRILPFEKLETQALLLEEGENNGEY